MKSDALLKQNVLDELEFEPRVNAVHIGVSAENGVISLFGHVASYAEKIAAEEAVRRVRGVKAIAQELEVRYPSDKKTADDQIAKRAFDILAWDASVSTNAIKVAVHDGWITLSGDVDWQYQRTAAEDAVRRLSGVIGIINQIKLKARVASFDVKKKIEEALKRSSQLEAKALSVQVLDNGSVELSGQVHSWHERRVVDQAAWSVPGVRAVQDNIVVQ